MLYFEYILYLRKFKYLWPIHLHSQVQTAAPIVARPIQVLGDVLEERQGFYWGDSWPNTPSTRSADLKYDFSNPPLSCITEGDFAEVDRTPVPSLVPGGEFIFTDRVETSSNVKHNYPKYELYYSSIHLGRV